MAQRRTTAFANKDRITFGALLRNFLALGARFGKSNGNGLLFAPDGPTTLLGAGLPALHRWLNVAGGGIEIFWHGSSSYFVWETRAATTCFDSFSYIDERVS
jgi:hypothetical protein